MTISRAKKSVQLTALEKLFGNAKGVAFLSFAGLTVEEAQNMRRELRAKGMSYTVIKKTLISIAAKNVGLPEVLSENLPGSVAVIISQSDEIAPAAAIKKFRKDVKNKKTKESKVNFAGAIFEGRFLSVAETAAIADTPSREESLGRIIGFLRSGTNKLHTVLNSGFSRIRNVLDHADKFAASNS